MVELVFRRLFPSKLVTAQPREIYLLPHENRIHLASLVLDKGPEGLLSGPGDPERIVVDTDAKFDDMLAASFLEQRLAGQPFPPACEAFARYTGLIREGIRPTKFPLDNSLEGIFLSLRCQCEKPLIDPETSRAFLADWNRLGSVIFRAAKNGANPFLVPFHILLRGGGADGAAEISAYSWTSRSPTEGVEVDFSKEHAFLIKDREVYRQDVQQGERWQVRLPGGPAYAQALLLRQPQSVLFEHWARSQCPPPTGGPYLFLAVTFWQGQWVFSVEPGQKVMIKNLAEKLQAAEEKTTPGAKENPWFDGKPTNYRVVAAPRAGTNLPDQTVLQLVRQWCRGRRLLPGGTRRQYVAAVMTIFLAAAVALWMFFFRGPSGPPLRFHDVYVLNIGVSKYDKLSPLPSAAQDAEDLEVAFKRLAGTKLCKFVESKVLTNEAATRFNILESSLGSWLVNQKAPTKHSLVIVTFSGHGLIDPVSNRYVFAPYDFNPQTVGTTGIFFADLERYLDRLPCPAIVLLDTCHSGAIGDDDAESPEKVLKTIKRSVDNLSVRYGLAVMAACAREQKANEMRKWNQHGAFTLAILEGLDGKSHYKNERLSQTALPEPGEGGLISLKEMHRYVADRVEQLSSEISVSKNRGQKVSIFSTSKIDVEQLSIGVR